MDPKWTIQTIHHDPVSDVEQDLLVNNCIKVTKRELTKHVIHNGKKDHYFDSLLDYSNWWTFLISNYLKENCKKPIHAYKCFQSWNHFTLKEQGSPKSLILHGLADESGVIIGNNSLFRGYWNNRWCSLEWMLRVLTASQVACFKGITSIHLCSY